jgi:dethiobiotin synthetase
MVKDYFITGTDTEIGKSWVSAGLISKFVNEGNKVAGMKPIASGCEQTPDGLRNEDALLLQKCCNVDAEYNLINPYHFPEPIAPHIAAEKAGVEISFHHILHSYQQLESISDIVIVEGVGGWRVPLGKDGDVAALARQLGLPVILVVGLRLGCINHALLTAEAIQSDGLELAGWVGNCVASEMAEQQANIDTLQQSLNAPCIGIVPYLNACEPQKIAGYLSL